MWQGCDAATWLRLLSRNHYAVEPPYWYIAAIVTGISLAHTFGRIMQEAIYGERIRATRVTHPPLFVVGHWRSGTTWLHELLIRDPRHSYASYYQCFEPHHFLLTEEFFQRWLWFLAPDRRPMDNMAAGWSRPQEDEFALCMLGQPSPYLGVAFPKHGMPFPEYLDLVGLSPQALRSWKRAFFGFVQRLTFRDGRRLVLKSPPHSARIPTLLELFPDARFVHIVRDPQVLFPSTVNLWKSLARAHGLQAPRIPDLEEYVFHTGERLYARLEEGRQQVPTGRFHEMRYEDLVRDPLGEMERLYAALDLGDFALARPGINEELQRTRNYETNRYEVSAEQRAEIAHRWGSIIQRYGYGSPLTGSSVPVAAS